MPTTVTTFGPSVPHNVEAEMAVLGCVLINPDSFIECRATIGAADFYTHKHRWVWDAFESVFTEQQPIDALTVTTQLERRNQLDEVGGTAYLVRLINSVPTSLHAAAYADIVKREAERRWLMNLAAHIAQKALDADIEIDTLKSEVVTTVLKRLRLARGGARPLREFVEPALDEALARIQNPSQLWGLDTGFYDLNAALGGLQRGEVMKVTGKPGIGKTQLVLQLCLQLAGLRFDGRMDGAGTPGAFYEMEMRGRAICRRALAALSGISTRALKTGYVADNKIPLLVSSANRLCLSNFHLDDTSAHTTSSLRADLLRMVNDYGIAWAAVDMENHLKDTVVDRWERQEAISQELSAIAKDLNLALVTIGRMNKDGIKGEGTPEMGHYGGGVGTLYDADTVLFLTEHQPGEGMGYPDPNLVTCTFAKSREEPAVAFDLRRNGDGIPFFGNLAGEA